MNIYGFSIWWRYSSDNFAEGIVKANSEDEAKEKVKKVYEGSSYIGMNVYEIVWEAEDTYVIFEK